MTVRSGYRRLRHSADHGLKACRKKARMLARQLRLFELDAHYAIVGSPITPIAHLFVLRVASSGILVLNLG